MSQKILKSLFTVAPSEERLKELDALAALLNIHSKDGLAVNFICTHNSRRSHFLKFFLELQQNIMVMKT